MLKQISVFLPNKPGVLAGFFELLMDNKIFIRSMTVAETEDYGLLLLLVDQYEKCVLLLEDKDYLHSVSEVVAVKLFDNISDLYNIAKTLGEYKINIEYLYFLILKSKENGIILRLDDNEGGVEVLRKHGFAIIDEIVEI